MICFHLQRVMQKAVGPLNPPDMLRTPARPQGTNYRAEPAQRIPPHRRRRPNGGIAFGGSALRNLRVGSLHPPNAPNPITANISTIRPACTA